MSFYGQDAEVGFLAHILPKLTSNSVIDVGAERGEFTNAMLGAGASEVHAFEPEPANAAFLRQRFGRDARVTVHETALDLEDGKADLHLSSSPVGAPVSFGHTLVKRADSTELVWTDAVSVTTHALSSLVADGTVPGRVGIVKVDTEGRDFAVVSHLGSLECDVVMTEHWSKLPRSLGRCPWTTEELVAELSPRGFDRFACFIHRGDCTFLQWNDGEVPAGAVGNIVFFHERVSQAVMPDLLEAASELAAETALIAERQRRTIAGLDAERRLQAAEAAARLEVIHELQDAEGDTLHYQRDELERALAALEATDEIPVGEDEAQLETILQRLDVIEQHLRPVIVPRRFAQLRYQTSRFRALAQPRLGRLRHYHSRPLQLPMSYFSARAPGNAPTISVVTPSFQHGRFIERTILSVLEQGYPAVEYVVQDGGSTDETVEILERHSDRLAAWSSEPDTGQADAINRAFDRTSGEIMGWLNSDDLLLPGALAYVGSYFADHPDVDVVYGNRLLIDDADGEIGAWVLPPHDDVALMLADFVPQETLFWRRRIWEAVGGSLDTSFGYAMDWDLLLRFQEAGAKMVRLPRFIGAFRIHDEQKTTAAHPLGELEMASLRERVFGRPLSVREVNERLRPYLRRHVAHHVRHRLAHRLPVARVTVMVSGRPEEPLDSTLVPDAATGHPGAGSASERATGEC